MSDTIIDAREMASELRKLSDRYIGMRRTEIAISLQSLARNLDRTGQSAYELEAWAKRKPAKV
jgi:hypothetical protein